MVGLGLMQGFVKVCFRVYLMCVCVVALGFLREFLLCFFFPMGSLIFLLACRGDRLL